jgi:hypothetical protein
MSPNPAAWAAPRPVVLVQPSRLDPNGATGPTRGQARGGRWRRVGPGLYVPSAVSADLPEQRIAEAAARLPPGGAVTGWAAGRLLGAGYLDGLMPDGRTRLPVPLAIGARARLRPGPGVRLLRNDLPRAEVTTALGVPCTTPERAALDAVRTTKRFVERLVVLDMLMLAELTSLQRLNRYAAQHAGLPGVALLNEALGLADENSWSPNETRTRKIWVVDAGLPPPRVNVPVFDRRGRLLGYPDLLDEEAGLVCEFDGADHRRAARHSADVDREATFRRHLLEVTRVTGPDLAVPDRVRSRLLAARSRTRRLPESERLWTTTPPPGWAAAPPLEVRLTERELVRGLG